MSILKSKQLVTYETVYANISLPVYDPFGTTDPEYYLSGSSIYQVTSGTPVSVDPDFVYRTMSFPDPSTLIGASITIIFDGKNSTINFTNNGYRPVNKSGDSMPTQTVDTSIIYKSIGSSWRAVS